MIHVLCLNPAVDKLFVIDDFTAGEDYPGQRPRIFAGGKGVNVARVLSQLGAAVRLIAFLGETGGEAIRRDMEGRCECVFIPLPGGCRTTTNIIDRKNGRETVLTEAGPDANAADLEHLLECLRRDVRAGDMVVCSGSLPDGLPKNSYAQISRLCVEIGAKCALDCNAKTLPDSLTDAAYVLGKPNERELCTLLGVTRTQDPESIAALSRKRMPPYEKLLCSMGAAGGVLTTAAGAYLAKTPTVSVRSTVGSGDASFAGALCAMAEGKDDVSVLRLAMACGAANAMDDGVGSVGIHTVRLLEKQIDIQKIG